MNTAKRVKFWKKSDEKIVALPTYEYEGKNEKGEKVMMNDTQVTLLTGQTMWDQRAILKAFPWVRDPKSDDSQSALIRKVVIAIKSWNFEDENDQLIEINDKNVLVLDEIDFMFLLWEVTGKTLVKNGRLLSEKEIAEIEKKD